MSPNFEISALAGVYHLPARSTRKRGPFSADTPFDPAQGRLCPLPTKRDLRFPFAGSRKCNSCGNKSTIMGEGKAYDCPPQGVVVMADRQQFFRPVEADPELAKILEASRTTAVTEEELREQRISFAFGNAPQDSEGRITKDSLRLASEHIRLLP